MSVFIKQRFMQTWSAEDSSAAEHRQAPNTNNPYLVLCLVKLAGNQCGRHAYMKWGHRQSSNQY
ncbi:hypothetical protein AB4160_19155 [Shewanella sp. 10N.286.51.B8]|uniref:hypothetical protein n=1 Tax=Shewanella sp. 10N.286.51.B8 TaxID=3229708 RepID=UPI00354D73F5